jgi:glutamine amidotransferase
MCRIAAYYGPPVSLSTLLEGPPHGLVHQSQAAREMTDSSVAGDGWGVGWFPERDGPPGMIKSVLPIWSCLNAKTAPHAITSGSFVGHIRLASPGVEVCFLNTPLYGFGDHLFTMNGELKPWPGPLSRALRRHLHRDAEAAVQGSTDAEMLGALWSTHLRRAHSKEPGQALRAALRQARDLAAAEGGAVKANVIVAWRGGFVAARYADSGEPNSLYVVERDGAALVASEALDDDPRWRAVGASALVRADAGGLRQEPLDLDAARGAAG